MRHPQPKSCRVSLYCRPAHCNYRSVSEDGAATPRHFRTTLRELVMLVRWRSHCILLKPLCMCGDHNGHCRRSWRAHESGGDVDANCCQHTARVRVRMRGCAHTPLAVLHFTRTCLATKKRSAVCACVPTVMPTVRGRLGKSRRVTCCWMVLTPQHNRSLS